MSVTQRPAGRLGFRSFVRSLVCRAAKLNMAAHQVISDA